MQSPEGLEDTPFSKMPTIKALDFLGQKLFLAIVVFQTKRKPRRIENLQN